jgi:hypothetical protein
MQCSPNILLTILFSNTLSLRLSLMASDQAPITTELGINDSRDNLEEQQQKSRRKSHLCSFVLQMLQVN